MRPSLARPPFDVKNVMNGSVIAPREVLSVVIPGMAAQQRSIAARDGKRGERFSADDHLTPRRLRVDNGCLAGHRDRFLEGANAHLGVDRDHARPGHLHALTLNPVEPGKVKLRLYVPGGKSVMRVLARPIADGPAGLLNQN